MAQLPVDTWASPRYRSLMDNDWAPEEEAMAEAWVEHFHRSGAAPRQPEGMSKWRFEEIRSVAAAATDRQAFDNVYGER